MIKLEKIFSDQCHYKIVGKDAEVTDVREFMTDFTEGLNHMNMSQYFYQKTSHVNIDAVLNRMKIEAVVYDVLTIYYSVNFGRLIYGESYDDIIEKLRIKVVKAMKNMGDSGNRIRLAASGIERLSFEKMMDKIIEELWDADFVETL